jgi:hypothetical protein
MTDHIELARCAVCGMGISMLTSEGRWFHNCPDDNHDPVPKAQSVHDLPQGPCP